MISVLSSKSQIKIPDSIISNMGLKEGDKFEIFEDNGIIRLIPVVVYPENYISEINDEICSLKDNIKAGKQPVFNNVDDLFASLEEN